MSVLESVNVYAWLAATLRADATLIGLLANGALGVQREMIPTITATAFPYVVISTQSEVDVQQLNRIRLWTTGLYQVTVYGLREQEDTLTVPAAHRVDTLLQHVTGSANGTLIRSCSRESSIAYAEYVRGIGIVSHRGGLWRIEAQAP